MITPKQNKTLSRAVTALVCCGIIFIIGIVRHEFYTYAFALCGMVSCVCWIGNITDTIER